MAQISTVRPSSFLPVRAFSHRIWEIDMLRGAAIICMMLFHFLYDLQEVYGVSIPSWDGFWYYEGKLTAGIFIFLAGISSTMSRNNAKRGLQILGAAMIITVSTYIYDPSSYIRFGILHLLAICMILYHCIKHLYPVLYIALGILSIGLGAYISTQIGTSIWGIPFGLLPKDFVSIDYYPLFPWIGIFCFGIYLGKTIYKDRTSLLHRAYKDHLLASMGRHSLFLYLIHQPIFLLILQIIKTL